MMLIYIAFNLWWSATWAALSTNRFPLATPDSEKNGAYVSNAHFAIIALLLPTATVSR
ncbi:hypothetical protein [Serratia microhaemolytica]|uniref:hypothetical protein n=1 Tax=Serratia microhaemolytica TaxID=2675110 RepID=UPI0012D74262|nr:hypothetical protein [Serratia microhaemolytica]